MIKSNVFYLFLVGIFLTLSVLSFYWFNNVDSYTNTHSANENYILESSANIWHKFNAVLVFLDIFSDKSKNQSDYNNINILDNPIEKGVKLASTLEVNEEIKNESKDEEQDLSLKSINHVVEEGSLKGKKWYKNFSQWIYKKGFFAFKKNSSLELGWQNYQGKTYSINIPY